jgi:pimeloyl-ACP methyl ester carboxylesterase
VRPDIYTKDVVDSYTGLGNTDIYKTFSTFMDAEVASHKVADWKAAPYDWRLGLDAVVNGGVSDSGHISYTDTATSSYMVNQVLALASSSPNHKVTIVAHSNGGLIAVASVSPPAPSAV